MTNYLMKMKDRQKVKIVSMDMWNPYRAAVKAVLPQARMALLQIVGGDKLIIPLC